MPFPSVRIITVKYFSVEVVRVNNIGKVLIVIQKSYKHPRCIRVHLDVQKS